MTVEIRTIASLAGLVVDNTQSIDSESEQAFEVPISADATDTQIVCSIDVSALEALIIQCDTGVVIETNSGSAADDTITITAGKPFVWYTGCGYDNPLGTDVTDLFVSEQDSAPGTLKIHVAQNATP